jgi:hypothetical protein
LKETNALGVDRIVGRTTIFGVSFIHLRRGSSVRNIRINVSVMHKNLPYPELSVSSQYETKLGLTGP